MTCFSVKMSTSLAAQLQQLSMKAAAARPDDIAQGRVSLMFNSKDAAGIDKETVFQFALDGLNELITNDPQFAKFRETLFGIDSKKLERSVVSADVNEELDLLISDFFILLAPHVLKTSAIKTLEWLVQRFNVQKFNCNQLVYMFIPFHEMKLFTRVIQIIDPKEVTHKWHWMYEIQQADRVVTKAQLHKFMGSHLDALSGLTQFVVKLNEVSTLKLYLDVYNNYYYLHLREQVHCNRKHVFFPVDNDFYSFVITLAISKGIATGY